MTKLYAALIPEISNDWMLLTEDEASNLITSGAVFIQDVELIEAPIPPINKNDIVFLPMYWWYKSARIQIVQPFVQSKTVIGYCYQVVSYHGRSCHTLGVDMFTSRIPAIIAAWKRSVKYWYEEIKYKCSF